MLLKGIISKSFVVLTPPVFTANNKIVAVKSIVKFIAKSGGKSAENSLNRCDYCQIKKARDTVYWLLLLV